MRDAIHIPSFKVLGGKLTFCGAEYVGQNAPPKMGTTVEVPAAIYDSTFYRTEYPGEFVEKQVEKKVGKTRKSLETMLGTLTGLGIFGALLIGPGLMFASGFAQWSIVTEVVLLLMGIVGLVLLATLPQLKAIREQSDEAYKKYPSIVAHLKEIS